MNLENLNPILLALIGTIFTWLMTAAGASLVFFVKRIQTWFMDTMMGFAAGVMIAASFWSLLNPAIEMTKGNPFPAAIGFLAGGLFLFAADKLLPHEHLSEETCSSEGLKTPWGESTLLFLAVTMHNFPEGLAVGVAYGAVAYGLETASLAGAIALTIGIGLQNLPEGAAVSIPLRKTGLSAGRSFFWGQISGAVEPIGGVIGAALVLIAQPFLPYALSFAAGAMIYAVAEEVIPRCQNGKYAHLAMLGLMLGFVVMMILDVALG